MIRQNVGPMSCLKKKSNQAKKVPLLSEAKPSGQGEESVVVALAVVVAGHMNPIFFTFLP